MSGALIAVINDAHLCFLRQLLFYIDRKQMFIFILNTTHDAFSKGNFLTNSKLVRFFSCLTHGGEHYQGKRVK